MNPLFLIIPAIFGLAALLPPPPSRTFGSCPLPEKPLLGAIKKDSVLVDKNDDAYWKTGEMFLVVGASQSGKTYWVKEQIVSVERLLTWDIEQQYERGCIVVSDIPTLAKLVRKNERKLRISYQPCRKDRQKEFLEFCLIAFCFCEAGLTHRNADKTPVKTCVVVEELASVTTCGKAPTEWGDLVRMGLKRNMWLYAVTQRPVEIDKTTVGNCSQIHCCGVQTPDDAERMRKYMGLTYDNIFNLVREDKQFIHKNCINGSISVGGIRPPVL